ncbi:MAG: DUF1634 domain-containing protein [Bryobacterales bacterium]|nr:DUF1634 domain-containing protein [Bryobacterales bacterium]
MTADDHQLEKLISLTLRSGVAVAVVLGVVGGAMFLSHHGSDHMDFSTFLGEEIPYSTLGGIAERIAGANEGLAIAQIGVLCLLMTPISRVALSIAGFLRERDWIFTAISATVLAILLFSLSMG